MDLDVTCWTVVRDAAANRGEARDDFARRYEQPIRAYLRARWGNSDLAAEIDDAVQDVFVECFRGALARADHTRPGGFRPYLYGVARNVALMTERRRARDRLRADADLFAGVEADEDSLATVFERAWAKAVLKSADARYAEIAAAKSEAAVRRRELLRLRFEDGLPIREIARDWGVDAARLHHDYATARREFRAALEEVLAFHHPGDAEEIEQECRRVLKALG